MKTAHAIVLGITSMLTFAACDRGTAPTTPPSVAEQASAEAPRQAVHDAVCAADDEACPADVRDFEALSWARGSAGVIVLEGVDTGVSVFAWQTEQESTRVRLVARVLDGSGAGIHNDITVEQVAVDDPERGTVSATVSITESERDPESCTTQDTIGTHLVVCAHDDALLCGGLRIGNSDSIVGDADCCASSEAKCPSAPVASIQAADATFEDGAWVIAPLQQTGEAAGDLEFAAEGRYSVEAFLNTFTLPEGGLG